MNKSLFSFVLMFHAALLTAEHTEPPRHRNAELRWDKIELRDPVSNGLWTLPKIASKSKGIVAVSINTVCPKTRHRIAELNALAKEYRKKGIQFIGVDGFDGDDTQKILSFSMDLDLEFPILPDPKNELTEKLEMTRTNEMVLLDKNLKVVYRGDISDGYGPHGAVPAHSNYLKNALEEFTNDKPISVSSTATDGCVLGHTPKTPKAGLNFCEHVAPIIKKSCQGCHNKEGGAPFTLTSYDDVKNWSPMIREVIRDRRMPPWNADPAHYPPGGFRDERRLSNEEIETITSWIDTKMDKGKEEKCPEPIDEKPGWKIGEPDLVISTGKSFEVPAKGEVEYQYFRSEILDFKKNSDLAKKVKVSIELPEKYKDGAWVQKSEMRPGNRSIVHHSIAHAVPPYPEGEERKKWEAEILNRVDVALEMWKMVPQEEKEKTTRMDWLRQVSALENLHSPMRANMAGNYVPGEAVRDFGDGNAVFIKPGSKIWFEMHYTPNGKAQKDFTPGEDGSPGFNTEVALKFTDKPTHRVITNPLAVTPMVIPSGDSNFEITNQFKFEEDSQILFLQPHMHKLGKNVKYEVQLANKQGIVTSETPKTTLLSVPRWDFRWQTEYRFKVPFKVPKGSVLTVTAHYDNSPMNPNNPNSPTKDVEWGFSTNKEMMNGWLGYTHQKSLQEEVR